MNPELNTEPKPAELPPVTTAPTSTTEPTAALEAELDTGSGVDFDAVVAPELVVEVESEPVVTPEETSVKAPYTKDDGWGMTMGAVGIAGIAGGIGVAAGGALAPGLALVGLSAYLAYRTYSRLTN